MLKWGSKMRPPFLNDLNMKYRTTGQPTRESKAESLKLISDSGDSDVPCLVKNTPVPPVREAADFRAVP